MYTKNTVEVHPNFLKYVLIVFMCVYEKTVFVKPDLHWQNIECLREVAV